jgi:hypothetical protein
MTDAAGRRGKYGMTDLHPMRLLMNVVEGAVYTMTDHPPMRNLIRK